MIFIDFKRRVALVVKRAEGKSARRAKLRQFTIKTVIANKVSEVYPVFDVLKDVGCHISSPDYKCERTDLIGVCRQDYFGEIISSGNWSSHKVRNGRALFSGLIPQISKTLYDCTKIKKLDADHLVYSYNAFISDQKKTSPSSFLMKGEKFRLHTQRLVKI